MGPVSYTHLDHGHRDGDGELLVHAARHAAGEGHGDEHGAQHQHDGDRCV